MDPVTILVVIITVNMGGGVFRKKNITILIACVNSANGISFEENNVLAEASRSISYESLMSYSTC